MLTSTFAEKDFLATGTKLFILLNMTNSKIHSDSISEIIKNQTFPMNSFPTDIKNKLYPLKGIKAILFDVYGTMLISGTGDIGVWEKKKKNIPISRILTDISFLMISENKIVDEQFTLLLNQYIKLKHKEMKSRGVDYPEVDIIEIWIKILKTLIDENYISGEIHQKAIELAIISYECIINPVWPMEGIDSTLKHLYKKELKLGIISNAQFYTPLILSSLIDFEIDRKKFDPQLLFYSYIEKLAKPSKDFFLKAVTKIKKLYNIDPDEILYIGNDMLNDIYTASLCNCRTALFAGDKRSLRLRLSDPRCRNLQPDIILTELEQLLELL